MHKVLPLSWGVKIERAEKQSSVVEALVHENGRLYRTVVLQSGPDSGKSFCTQNWTQNLGSSTCWIRQDCFLLTLAKSRICWNKKGGVVKGGGSRVWVVLLPEGRAGWWCQARTQHRAQQLQEVLPFCKSSATVCCAVVARWSTQFSCCWERRRWHRGIHRGNPIYSEIWTQKFLDSCSAVGTAALTLLCLSPVLC